MTVDQYNNCVNAYADAVYRFVLKNLRDEEASRDVVQESFEKMWTRAAGISYEKARSYLFTTAYHQMVDHIRKEKRMTGLENEGESYSLSTQEQYSDLKEILDEAVRQLPDDQRSVLLLRDYEGYSYREIGEITGLSEAQVKVYIYRARMFLKNYIGKPENVI